MTKLVHYPVHAGNHSRVTPHHYPIMVLLANNKHQWHVWLNKSNAISWGVITYPYHTCVAWKPSLMVTSGQWDTIHCKHAMKCHKWDITTSILAHHGIGILLWYLDNCGWIWQTFSDVVYGKEISMFSYSFHSNYIHSPIDKKSLLEYQQQRYFLQHSEIGWNDGDLYEAKYKSKLVFI